MNRSKVLRDIRTDMDKSSTDFYQKRFGQSSQTNNKSDIGRSFTTYFVSGNFGGSPS